MLAVILLIGLAIIVIASVTIILVHNVKDKNKDSNIQKELEELEQKVKDARREYDDDPSSYNKKRMYEMLRNQYERYDETRMRNNDDNLIPNIAKRVGIITSILLVLGIGFNSIYSQDVGETVVIRNLGGSVAGHTEEAGFHFKFVWQDALTYDTRNNLINMYQDADYTYDGGSANGKEVTINDKSGASADIDIQVIYSLDPSTAEYLYQEYGTQTNFTQNYISNDFRSIVREVAGQFDTITMLTDRSQFTNAVTEKLTQKWGDMGLTVESVNVQDIRYPETITSKYAEATAAIVEQQTATNKQETARIEAETKKITAQGDADANAILSESLTDEVLTQKYIDAIDDSDTVYVVPEGSSPLITTEK